MSLNNMLYKRKRSPERAARTRTLIQLGGLIEKVGLTDMFSIIPGEDLQSEISSLDKAATLYGFLLEAYNKSSTDSINLERWYKSGLRFMKANN
jgi:hypothetical protein